MLKHWSIFAIVALFFVSCGGNQKFDKTPVDKLITELDSEKTYSIILYDMNIEDKTFSDTYKHRYKIITQKDSTPQEKITDWYVVSEPFFARHQNDLGMEVCAKTNGKISKVTAPPGYSTYVGNAQYGQWKTGNDGNSFWEFYGKYAMMSSMLGLASSVIHRNSYNDYYSNYYGRQPYYGGIGAGGHPMYGTMSAHSQTSSPSFHQRAASNNSFKNKINDRVSRSSSSWGSGSNSSRNGSTKSSGSSSSSSGSSWFGRKSSSSSSSGSHSSSGSRSSGRSRRR
jgi:hypothetical protein